ncbi:hypothetical protein QN277_002275 [Acacia crassicarpa]|uniref:NAC domain-containing protein n=1 Tax=Acacia crassicarpa TaxID=499986 RepID=A0AAE1NA37_9FABA|nr:hypothetical protein QN277_002275 [Acacia crassicarpa]
MMQGSGQIAVPPGFRFHPTEEELLYYYLRKKVSFEAIDLDVIREVDLNKLEPWDLKEKCRIGSGPQNEWYFFSHKDKKYPTGTRTNRATMAGFWKATGRDKAIFMSNSKRIGMRKTLVFYTGRAPHGQKTDWIMHEYRLDQDDADQLQEDGWVVCRVFKKKNFNRGFQQEMEEDEQIMSHHMASTSTASHNNCMKVLEPLKHVHHQHHHHQGLVLPYYDDGHHNNINNNNNYSSCFNASMHLPQLFSPESAVPPLPSATSSSSSTSTTMNPMDVLHCSQSLLRLASTSSLPPGGLLSNLMQQQCDHQRLNNNNGEWSFLEKLLASQQQHQPVVPPLASSSHKFPFHYLACDQSDIMK